METLIGFGLIVFLAIFGAAKIMDLYDLIVEHVKCLTEKD
jgi:hypothetical protein